MAAALLPMLLVGTLRAPQRISLREQRTRMRVVLVGVMHHNSRSVALASRTVHEMSTAEERLRAVLIESCPTRWNT